MIISMIFTTFFWSLILNKKHPQITSRSSQSQISIIDFCFFFKLGNRRIQKSEILARKYKIFLKENKWYSFLPPNVLLVFCKPKYFKKMLRICCLSFFWNWCFDKKTDGRNCEDLSLEDQWEKVKEKWEEGNSDPFFEDEVDEIQSCRQTNVCLSNIQ